MEKFILKKWANPLLLLVMAILAYGLFIPRLGLFGDDWPHLWVLHTYGLQGLNQLVAWDRPFSSWVYWLIAPLAGDHIWVYHVYLLFLRWICAVFFYFLLNEILPDSKPVPFWASSFFLLYPGFRQEPQPLEFTLHFTALALMLFSFWCMIKASKKASNYWPLQAIGTVAALSIFSVEYFIGLELLRPVFLLISERTNGSSWKQALKRTGLFWLPYALVLSGYAFWRVFIFKFPTYKPTFLGQIGTNPLEAMMGLGQVLVEEVRAAILGAWRQIISIPLDSKPGWIYLFLITGSALVIYIWLKAGRSTAGKTSPVIPLFIGILAVATAGIPFWITGIPVQLDFPWDRSTLPFMLGASLIVCGGLLLFKPVFRNILASMIIALTIGMHFQSTAIYQVEWNKLSQFFWQLTWRAPSLKPGTIVISDAIPLMYYGDNNLTPVLNWTYSPEQKSTELSYNFFDMGERLGTNLPELKPGLPVEHGYRFVTFKSNSSNLLPVFYKEGSCLKVIDRQNAMVSTIPKRLRAAAEFSKPEERILSDGEAIPPAFIPEPDHEWCYYYQKAELATQMEKWDEVVALFAEASQKKFEPSDKTEWLPYIEALAETGAVDKAVEITKRSLEQEGTKQAVCGVWSDILLKKSTDSQIIKAIQIVGCD
jgi:hypothetical protein